MSNSGLQRPTTIEITSNYAIKVDYDVSNNPIYIGLADIGSSTAAAVWQIKKASYDVSNNFTGMTWADSNNLFDNIWDNRTGLTYG